MEIKIEQNRIVPKNQQSAEFHRFEECVTNFAAVRKGSRTVFVDVNGEMDITIPLIVNGELDSDAYTDIVIRYTDDLLHAGITNDLQLWQYIKTMSNIGHQVMHQNPWWELFDDELQDSTGGIYDTFDDALRAANEYIRTDNVV